MKWLSLLISAVRDDYGAGGGNFIGVCAGVDASKGVGDAVPDSVGDADCVGCGVGMALVDVIGNDFRGGSDDLAG